MGDTARINLQSNCKVESFLASLAQLISESDLSVAELIGVLEIAKAELLGDLFADEDDAEA
jgi:hypothetical protein